MERILLKLYNSHLPNCTQNEWSHSLGISQRHLSRLLQKYQQQGVLSFSSGRGRGNKTKINWHLNVDDEYCRIILQQMNRDDIEEILPILNWEWSKESRQKLLLSVYSLLGTVQNGKDKLTVKRRYAKNTTHPLELFDIETRRVLVNIYETLITVNDDGQINYKLAHHIDFEEKQCIIHLRKNIYFHDGTLMTSHHAADCLNKAKQSEQLGHLMKPITSIVVIDTHTLIIHHHRIPYIPYLLGSLHLAIYHEQQQIYGTGPFYIAEDNEHKTTLKNSNNYWGIHALLDEVELVYLPELRINQQHTVQDYSSSAKEGVTYMLSLTDNQLSYEQRAYFHSIVQKKFRFELAKYKHINQHTPKILSRSQYYRSNPEAVEIKSPVRIIFPEYLHQRMQILQRLMEDEGVIIQLIPISFYESSLKYSADYSIHGFYFVDNEVFEYYRLLFTDPGDITERLKQIDLSELHQAYINRPITDWPRLNILADRYLEKHHLLVPLYNSAGKLPVPYESINNHNHIYDYDWHKVWIDHHQQKIRST